MARSRVHKFPARVIERRVALGHPNAGVHCRIKGCENKSAASPMVFLRGSKLR
jgi:hypothetical protein